MKTLTFTAVLLLTTTQSYASGEIDEITSKFTHQQLEHDMNIIMMKSMDEPKTRLDDAIILFQKLIDERNGK